MPKKVVLQPVFCRIGTKRDLTKFILDYFPPPSTYDTYVEPFIGGGAIYWKAPRKEREVINDLDSDLIADYLLLKRIKSREFKTDLNTVPKLQRFLDDYEAGRLRKDADNLTGAIISRCNRFASKEDGPVFADSNPYRKLKKIDDYQERMKNTKILNKSYEKVINEYDGKDTFFYLDPPYEEKTKKLGTFYKHGGTTFDYEALAALLKTIKGRFLLSINDSPNIRRIFKGFYYKAFSVTKRNIKTGPGSVPRKELIIGNYVNKDLEERDEEEEDGGGVEETKEDM